VNFLSGAIAMKPAAFLTVPAALLAASFAVADQNPQTVVLACHVNVTSQENGKPEHNGKADLAVTMSVETAPNGYLRVIASHPGSFASFDTFKATSAGLTTPQGTFRDVSTSGSWTVNRSLRTTDSQEFEEVIINRVSGELFYQKQVTNKLGAVLYTRNAFGPCVQKSLVAQKAQLAQR
jgi:hypothetical protein